ncbi:hypothetical protein S40285_07890 [Stachybotrys chlorohalonatus IBT 40285]|uniref:Glutamine amidotransferase domain-containing protein n=1 Tax=Stachybotrys chlorohalonatus (strain IBT 40285) TaxID=1283841 RepID=A0A084R216_STAC4|nr:hypothetical protein S40285_07890 [Stachybotrys chlorohalonata IBT 40285]
MSRHFRPTIDAPVIKLFVLETDETAPEQESFAEILHNHMSKAGASHHPPLGIETEQELVVPELGGRVPKYEEFEGYDGLLITGSRYDAHGDDQWIMDLLDLLRELWKRRPAFCFTGVCFGCQLLARLLGAKIGPAPSGDWELAHSKINLSPVGQRLFRTKKPEIFLHQMHADQVKEMPGPETADGLLKPDTEVQCWGSSEHTPIQGLYIPSRLFTTQAHLAFDEDMVRRQIEMRVESGGIQDLAHADQARETAHLEHDGDKVAAAILRVFQFDNDGVAYEEDIPTKP